MSIKIEMRESKWRMTIESESWEFDNQADMLNELNNLLTLKNTHGRLKKNGFDSFRDSFKEDKKNNNTYTNAR